MANLPEQALDRSKNAGLRFGLCSLLIVLVIVSALFGSYRLGYDHGRELGPIIPSNFHPKKLYDREYDVSDIVSSAAEAEMVISSVREMVEQESWDVVGGYASISYNTDAGTFMVSHPWPGHVKFAIYLRLIRDYARGPASLADALAQAEAHVRSDRIVREQLLEDFY